MNKKVLEKIINEELDRLWIDKECPHNCYYCQNWSYPCSYGRLLRIGATYGIEVWNSNEDGGYISFAPTTKFDLGECYLIVAPGYWEILDKEEG